jgi:pantothenate kinase-related protein Tda10
VFHHFVAEGNAFISRVKMLVPLSVFELMCAEWWRNFSEQQLQARTQD